MGADIHMYVEKKLKDQWATVQTFAPVDKAAVGLKAENAYDWLFFDVEGRNYALFAKLASVRGEGAKPKGIPKDASPLFRDYARRWASDGHSHSWCSATEFIGHYLETLDPQSQAVKRYASWVLEGGSNNAALRFLDVYCSIRVEEDENANDYRFCFFFDN